MERGTFLARQVKQATTVESSYHLNGKQQKRRKCTLHPLEGAVVQAVAPLSPSLAKLQVASSEQAHLKA